MDVSGPALPAIVLTCQRHIPFAEHLVDTYEELWPHHPMVFRIPDGSAAKGVAERHTDRVQLVPTAEGEGRGRFRDTVLDLVGDLDDDDWVLWCIDDKYPIRLDVTRLDAVVDQLEHASHIDGFAICRSPSSDRPGDPDPADAIEAAGLVWHRRTTYRKIWLHQFLRVKVLRHLFGSFPPVIERARTMDQLKDRLTLPAADRLYVTSTNLAIFGESTIDGAITANCARSMRRGRGLPEGFDVSSRSMIVGQPRGLARIRSLLGRR